MSQQQIALANAMETQRPFSWLRCMAHKTHCVQAGVYITYTQEYFAKYIAK